MRWNHTIQNSWFRRSRINESYEQTLECYETDQTREMMLDVFCYLCEFIIFHSGYYFYQTLVAVLLR